MSFGNTTKEEQFLLISCPEYNSVYRFGTNGEINKSVTNKDAGYPVLSAVPAGREIFGVTVEGRNKPGTVGSIKLIKL